MPEPFPAQITGAQFLAAREVALLADEQRVGKTGAGIRACDYVFATTILVITKASARAQWGRELRVWGLPREIQVVYSGTDRISPDAQAVVVGWSMIYVAAILAQLLARHWDVLIPDECHEAKNADTRRSRALYGTPVDDGADWYHAGALVSVSSCLWPLSGTPVPNAPNDLWPLLRAKASERLLAGAGGPESPDVTTYQAFLHRYCQIRRRPINGVWRDIVKGGKNLDELNARLVGLWLRRTQKDVGIRPPIFSVFALHVDKLPAGMADDTDAAAIMDAIETGETKSLEMHLGPLRRITGTIKAHAVVEAAKEQLADGTLDKLVLMAWHTDVLDVLWGGLAKFGVCGIDGRTSATDRDKAVTDFAGANKRVFVGQIQAAGEAIDLSPSAELWFVEPSFVPKDMSQAALRITNHSQQRQPLVRVCALAGSIDEAVMGILTDKVATIRQIMEQ